nr:radical SAM protein [uncultured Desulfobacter sp.]
MNPEQALDRLTRYGVVPANRLIVAVTRHCNLTCSHCWVECSPASRLKHVDAELIKETISLWVDAGVKTVCISGGEPLTHPRWQEILTHCAQFPTVHHLRLQTNGTLLTQEIVDTLATSVFDCLHLQISVDGAQPDTHDRVRGKGNFEKTMNGLKLLSKAGLGPRTTVSFTEMAHNFEELPRLFVMMEKLNISRVVSGTLIHGGRALTGTLRLPSPEQYAALIDRFTYDEQFRRVYEKIGNTSCLEWYGSRHEVSEHHCANCMESPYISQEGTLFPCGLLSVTNYGIDGVWNCSVDRIADQAENKWAGLNKLSKTRSEKIEACATCSGRLHCQSGCMARPTRQSDIFFEEVEDRCRLRKQVYAYPNRPKL